jgi:tetratricopeptide (TPR) repeat protein
MKPELGTLALAFVAALAASSPVRADSVAVCASGNAEAAVRACTEVLAGQGLTPARRAIAAFNRGYNYFQLGRIGEAIADYTQAISLVDSNPQFYNNRGFAYRTSGRYDLAIADFNRAIQLSPNNHIFHYNRGTAHEQSGNLQGAVTDYTRSVELNAGFALGHLALARTLGRTGRADLAIARFTETVTRFPQNAFAQIEFGRFLHEQKRYDEAIAAFGRALQFEPRSVFALHGRGLALTEKGDLQGALADINAALAINPRYAAAYNDRGNIYYRLENFAQAESDFSQGLALLPSQAFAYNNRGNARHKLGRHAEALLDYTQAIALDANYAEAYANRGETYLALNDLERAAQDYNRAAQLAPALTVARAGIDRVQRARNAQIALRPLPQAPAGPASPPAAPPAPRVVPGAAPAPLIPVVPAAPPVAAAPVAGKRVALVIGNAAYQNTGALLNPANDSTDIAGALRRLNFEVVEGRDLDKRGMDDAFRRFARLVRDSDLALFFYAGHAMQYQGVNYLMPVDARLKDEADLPYEMAKLSDVMEDMARAKGIRIAIIDACRDNPLEQKLKRSISLTRGSATRGLAKIEKVEGSVIVYATQAGSTADDGDGRNSPFTTALLKHLETPQLEIGILFRRVASAVHAATQGRQFPEISLSLVSEIYLR